MADYDDHLYFTFVDIGFGLALGISIEYLVNIIQETPGTAFNYGIDNLHIIIIFLFTASTIFLLASKWLIYRLTFVNLYNRIDLKEIVKDIIDRNLTILATYIVIEFMFSLSPIIYFTTVKMKMALHLSLPRFLDGPCTAVMFILPNYAADIYITHPSRGLYGKLMRRIRELRDKYGSSVETHAYDGYMNLIEKLSKISNNYVTAMNTIFLLSLISVGFSQVIFGYPGEPWDIGIVLVVLLSDTSIASVAALRIFRSQTT